MSEKIITNNQDQEYRDLIATSRLLFAEQLAESFNKTHPNAEVKARLWATEKGINVAELKKSHNQKINEYVANKLGIKVEEIPLPNSPEWENSRAKQEFEKITKEIITPFESYAVDVDLSALTDEQIKQFLSLFDENN